MNYVRIWFVEQHQTATNPPPLPSRRVTPEVATYLAKILSHTDTLSMVAVVQLAF